jgi:hypothetical protein
MSGQHTPGPWVATQEFANRWRITAPAAEGMVPESLAIVTHTVLEAGSHGENTEANARLIAAAPDLLEALIECLECEFAVTEKSVVAKARAVIERATKGESGNEYTKGGGLSYEGASRTDVRGHQATEETGNDRPAAPINKCSKCNGTGKATT